MALQKIVSFGFRHEWPPVESPGTVVVDVRTMFRNPYHNKALRKLRGTDKPVQDEIMSMPNFVALYEHLKQRITVPGTVTAYIGCTGGHHRSVFLAQKLGADLGVAVEHRDINHA
jgi:RNase adapter protein RapZ